METVTLNKRQFIFLSLLVFIFFANHTPGFSQTEKSTEIILKNTQSNELQRISKEFSEKYHKEKQKAVEMANEKGWIIRKEFTDGRVMEIQRISENGKPIYYITHNANAAATISTDEVYPGGSAGLDLDGTGVIVGEWDGGGVLTTHQEFVNTGESRVFQKDEPGSTNAHATHVAGTMIAGGVNSDAKGMAFNGTLHAYEWGNDLSEMAQEAGEGLLISNHSYGYTAGWNWDGSQWNWVGDETISSEEDYRFGFYGDFCVAYDQIAYNAPYYLIVKSAGNDRGDGPSDGDHPQDGGSLGYDCIGYWGNAKNILTVGATEDLTTGYEGNPDDVVMTSFSSWGPSDDGRIKPDISANGDALYSTSNESETSYTGMSGTSMSSPSAAGSLVLLQQHAKDVLDTYVTAATLKALVVHSADEAGDNPGPDYEFGWGLMNTAKAADLITENNKSAIVREGKITEGDSTTFDVVTNGEPLIATLVWTDPPGTPTEDKLDPRTPMLLNDLDLTIEGKVTYHPYKLNPETPSSPATTGDNDVDNVEKIVFDSPNIDQVFTIKVKHEGSLENGSQNYSLIVSGIKSDYSPHTDSVYKVGQDTAIVDAEIKANTKATIVEKGIAYSTSNFPSVEDNTAPSGTSTGKFTTVLKNLTPYKKYYARAYVTTENTTYYGNTKTFNTLPWDVDVRADSLINPASTISEGNEELKLQFKNIGFNTLTDLEVEWWINNAKQTNATWSGNVVQDSAAEIVLGTYDFPSSGEYNLQVNILNANGIEDPNEDNNTLKATIDVIAVGQLLENFEYNAFLPTGWSETANDNKWQRFSNEFFVQIDGYDAVIGQDINDSEERLITPKLTIDGSSSKLNFTVAGGNNTYDLGSTTLQIQYSKDGNNWNDMGEPIDLANFGEGEGGDLVPQDFSYLVDTLNPDNYYFAFTTESDFDYTGYKSWLVLDNISGPIKTEISDNDLTLTEREFVKEFVFEGETVEIPAEVRNQGKNPQSDFDVTLQVDGNIVDTKTVTKSIGYVETAVATLEWTSTSGRHNFAVAVPNDDQTHNDTIKFHGVVAYNGSLTQGFENEMPPNLWEKEDNDNWSKLFSDWPPHWSGNHAAAASNIDGFSDEILSTPRVKLTGNETLFFYANAGNLSIGETYVDIVYSESRENWTQVGSSIYPTTDVELYEVNLSSITPGDYFLGFRATGEGDGDNGTILVIDHVIGPEQITYYDLRWEVTDGSDPISDAKIFYSENGSPLKELNTNSEGIATVSISENTDLDYYIVKNGFANKSGNFTATEDDTLSFTLSSGDASWPAEFKITDASADTAMKNAEIEINSEVKTTNTSGQALFMLNQGSYDYTVKYSGYRNETGSIDVSSSMINKDISMNPLFNVTFSVTDSESSEAVENATISIADSSLTTDAQGEASVQLINESYSYLVVADGYENATGSITAIAGDTTIQVSMSEAANDIQPTIAEKLKLYPNPASGNITVEGDNITGSMITVRAVTGDMILQRKATDKKVHLDLGRLSNGVYLLEITKKQEKITRKIVIE